MNKIFNNIFVFSTISIMFCFCSEDSENLPDEFICDISNVSPKGNRVVGIDLLDLTESNTFDENLKLASELNVDFFSLHLAWTSIETSPNNYEDPENALEILGQTASNYNLKISLTIKPIDIPGKMAPSDLENSRFNTVEMINRFKLLVDFIFSKVDPEVLLNFQIGNEIDAYDISNEPLTFWDDYGIFLNEITSYIHSINPDLKTGYTGTLYGLVEQQAVFNKLLQNVDILGVTYYPINSDFSVKDPEVIFDDFDNLVTAFDDKPVYLQEIGYQTGSLNKSNESKQSEFYCNVFKAWDSYSTKILSINICRLNDLSVQAARESAVPYGISSDKFVEYLKTLGIRRYENKGTNKPAFVVIKENILKRNW